MRHPRSLAPICAAAVLVFASQAAVAATPQPVTITSHTERFCPPPSSESCRFEAEGAIEDSGTVVSLLVVAGGGSSPVVGTAQWIKTFQGDKGSFTIRLQSQVTADGDSLVLPETGNWVVIDGTGDYAGLKGQGTESGVRDYGPAQSLDATLTGRLN